MSADFRALPRWADTVVLPLINVALALIVAGIVVAILGVNPLDAIGVLAFGAFGYDDSLGYTLYYTTNFIFTGLAVAIAFHGGLFNIGGEGQAYIAGLGVAIVMLALDSVLPAIVLVPLGILAAMIFGALWIAIPACLQAYRGSHIVITTIMFNFIAAALMIFLLVDVLIKPGQMSPETREFLPSAFLPRLHEIAGWLGLSVARSPLNLSFIVALAACVFFWFYVWRTPAGFELRAVGLNEHAAVYGGVRPPRVVVRTLLLSGALAGLAATNEIMGVHHRLLQDFVAGYGFTGIAVALMGRNHPVGIFFAALLFGILYQGGSELSFEYPRQIPREMVTAIQGLIILFSGALALMLRGWLERLWASGAALFQPRRKTQAR